MGHLGSGHPSLDWEVQSGVIFRSYPSGSGEALERTEVNVIDLTWQRLPFQYTAHTSDNVQLLIEGSLFWRIRDVRALLNATDDPARDVWVRTRSSLIQAISRSSLADFMQNFNNFHELSHESLQESLA
eukprot:2016918-Amphidinium_carterae.1